MSDEQMQLWGWRIPFLAAIPWGLCALALRGRLHEPARGAEPPAQPFAVLWREHRRAMLLAGLIVAAQITSFNVSIVLPKELLHESGLRSQQVAIATAPRGHLPPMATARTSACEKPPGLRVTASTWQVASLACMLGVIASLTGHVLSGMAVDSHGVFRTFAICVFLLAILSWPLWALMCAPAAPSATLVASTLLGLVHGLTSTAGTHPRRCPGPIPCRPERTSRRISRRISLGAGTYLALALFPPCVRATGFGIAMNSSAAFFASASPFIGGRLATSPPRLCPRLMPSYHARPHAMVSAHPCASPPALYPHRQGALARHRRIERRRRAVALSDGSRHLARRRRAALMCRRRRSRRGMPLRRAEDTRRGRLRLHASGTVRRGWRP